MSQNHSNKNDSDDEIPTTTGEEESPHVEAKDVHEQSHQANEKEQQEREIEEARESVAPHVGLDPDPDVASSTTKKKHRIVINPMKLKKPKGIDDMQKKFHEGMENFEKNIEHGLENIQKETKLVFSSGRTTADFIEFESIERVKVNSFAAKALSKSQNKWQLKRRRILYWLMCFEIGFLVGLIEFLNHEGISQIQNGRIYLARLLLRYSWYGFVGAWFIYTSLAVVVVMFGCALCVYVSPATRGGGIAEVKAFLNGVKISGLLNLKAGLVKLFGTMCSVGAGLAVGQEGPMIHIGAVLGHMCSQMKFKALPGVSSLFSKFQNDRDKRDFVASGAAAGVSAAFRSPIGATLFSIEEAASFWSHQLIWRTFFCCMVASWATNLFVGSKEYGWKLIDNPSHVVYRVALGNNSFKLWELFFFIGVGVLGGLLGTVFIQLNLRINGYRKRTYWTKNRNKFIELLIITVVTASLSFIGPLLVECRDLQEDIPGVLKVDVELPEDERQTFEQFHCQGPYQYSPLASLSFAPGEVVLKHLYLRSNPKAFGPVTLISYAIGYFIMMLVTAGTWIPAGLLVPQLICGAAWGRLFGYLLYLIRPEIDPGIYALLGSSAFLSGVSRITVALVVIMIEITGDLNALLPLMTVCLVSKWCADIFNHSIYDEALHAGKIPFLEPDPPRLATVMTSKEAMIGDRYCVPEVATVEQCFRCMKDSSHANIPVVDAGPEGNNLFLKGSIPRAHLAVLLQERAFEKKGLIDILGTKIRPNTELSFTNEELGKKLDLRPYTNVATFSVREEFPLYLTYRIFRSLGLRQLFVVDNKNELRGFIGRNELMIHDMRFHGHGQVLPGGGHGNGHSSNPPHGNSVVKRLSQLGLRNSMSSSKEKLKIIEQKTENNPVPKEVELIPQGNAEEMVDLQAQGNGKEEDQEELR